MLKSNKSSSRPTDDKVSNVYVPRGASGGQMSPRRDVEAGAGGVHDPESCCGCCGCGDTFLTSPTGFAKLAEVTFATLCQFLLLNYGVE